MKNENTIIDTRPTGIEWNRNLHDGIEWAPEKVEKFNNMVVSPPPVAYEFHNFITGHLYVDYIARLGQGENDGYTKKDLFYG